MKKFKEFYKLSIYKKIKTDLDFKVKMSLYISVGINLIYSFSKALAGIYYHSLWFGIVAIYYIVLTVVRFLLLNHIQQNKRNHKKEAQKYCLCGYLLLILTLAIIGMNIYMIHEGKVSTYPLNFIYAVAGYTFYSFITAVMNIVRYRKTNNLIYHASKMISLATALVSVFSLQTAMFAEFGNDYVQQRMMNILTGFCVFMLTIAIALYMIIRSKIILNKMTNK